MVSNVLHARKAPLTADANATKDIAIEEITEILNQLPDGFSTWPRKGSHEIFRLVYMECESGLTQSMLKIRFDSGFQTYATNFRRFYSYMPWRIEFGYAFATILIPILPAGLRVYD
jgi:hypothetical protein